MYKKLIVPVVVAVVATVGLSGGTVSAIDMSAAEFDQNNNKAVVEVTCDSITLGISQNMPRGDWLRSFYVGSGTKPANNTVFVPEDNVVDLLPGVVHERAVDSEGVEVYYFSGNRDNVTPATWQYNQGWVPVETTVVNLAEDCPVAEQEQAEASVEQQVAEVPVGGVNAGGGAIVASFMAFVGSLTGLVYGIARLRKTSL